jgi:hypothetical protein
MYCSGLCNVMFVCKFWPRNVDIESQNIYVISNVFQEYCNCILGLLKVVSMSLYYLYPYLLPTQLKVTFLYSFLLFSDKVSSL